MPTTGAQDRLWLSPIEAAAYLGVSERTIRTYMRNGLPHHRVRGSRLIRINRADLDGMLEQVTA